MKIEFDPLAEDTRQLMLNEIDHDIINEQLYLSRKFNNVGKQIYPELLKQAMITGNEKTLATALKQNGCFETHVSETTPDAFAERAFNSFYMRAACVKAFENGQPLKIYLTQPTTTTNPQTAEALLDKAAQLKGLLERLRKNMAVEKALDLSLKQSGQLSAKAV